MNFVHVYAPLAGPLARQDERSSCGDKKLRRVKLAEPVRGRSPRFRSNRPARR